MTRAVLLLLGLSLPVQTLAQSPGPAVPERRVVLTNLLAVRLNPLGLENQTRLGHHSVLYRNDLVEDNDHHRVGLLAAYVFWDEGYTSFNKPAVLLNVAWYLKHRYRTGAEVSQAVPYVVLGFAFQSDLLDG